MIFVYDEDVLGDKQLFCHQYSKSCQPFLVQKLFGRSEQDNSNRMSQVETRIVSIFYGLYFSKACLENQNV